MARTAPTAERREAILQVAIEVFGRDGFADAGMDEIARVAGVAKPTLYNWFDDKSALFVAAVRFGSARAVERVSSAIGSLDPKPTDLRAELERIGSALVGCFTHPEGAAIMRMHASDHARVTPELGGIRASGRDRNLDELAGKLAQLSAHGKLRRIDPAVAARHFLALVTSDAVSESDGGLTAIAPDRLDAVVRDGVDTFLAAFGPEDTP